MVASLTTRRSVSTSATSTTGKKTMIPPSSPDESSSSLLASTSKSTTLSTSSTTPNWRVLKTPQRRRPPSQQEEQQQRGHNAPDTDDDDSSDDVVRAIVHDRPAWSEACFRDSLALYERFTAGGNGSDDNNAGSSSSSSRDAYVSGQIATALSWLDHAYRLYGPESVICSFNGGKDAVVILHLVRAAHARYYQQLQQQQKQQGGNNDDDDEDAVQAVLPCRPRVVYFNHDDEFPEVLHFLRETVSEYDLDMVAFERGVKFAQGLEVLVEHNIPTSLAAGLRQQQQRQSKTGTAAAATQQLPSFPMAFVLGTRTTDPNAGQQGHFAPSSHYMPPFMRVNPILEWTYGHVWHFLRLYKLPYCSLYDQGYTSLGTIKDTFPCPALAIAGASFNDSSTSPSRGGGGGGGGAVPRYWPAYMLRDWDQERAGRIPKDKKVKRQGSSTSSRPSGSAVNNSRPRNEQQNDNIQQHVSAADSKSKYADEEEASCSNISLTRANESLGQLSILSELRTADNNPLASVARAENEGSAVSYGSSRENDHDDDHDENANARRARQKTVGMLIIGDEILKGLTADTNSGEAAKVLREQGVVLKRVVVVRDDLWEIVREIERLQEQVDVIITSGGIGPTHDDVTIKSVAKALDCDLVLHQEMAELLIEKMNSNSKGAAEAEDAGKNKNNKNMSVLSEAQKKMATLPRSSKLRYLSDDSKDWPVLQCRNIFVLPGVPEFFAKKIPQVAKYLSCQFDRSVAYKVVLSVDENSIVPVLNQVVEHHPAVSFGSYPFVSHPEFKTVITVEGKLVTSPSASPATTAPVDAAADSNMDDTARIRNSATGSGSTTSSSGRDGPRNSGVLDSSLIDTPKAVMDQNVLLALDELINTLPQGSVLRVDNEDLALSS